MSFLANSAIVNYLPYLAEGLLLTLWLSVAAIIGSAACGFVICLMRMSRFRPLRWLAMIYIDVLRMIPLIMVIFWFYFFLPIVSGHAMPPLLTVLLALVFYNASYMAEVFRAGFEAVPRGVIEAARSTGLGYFRTVAYIIAPLALSYMMPTLTTRIISVVMGTSLSYIIGVPDFFRAAYNVNSSIFRPYEIFIFVAIVYFLLCYGISIGGGALHKLLSRHEFRNA